MNSENGYVSPSSQNACYSGIVIASTFSVLKASNLQNVPNRNEGDHKVEDVGEGTKQREENGSRETEEVDNRLALKHLSPIILCFSYGRKKRFKRIRVLKRHDYFPLCCYLTKNIFRSLISVTMQM